MIVDPFDFTYNPGRQVRCEEQLEGQYKNRFKRTLQSMLDEGTFI